METILMFIVMVFLIAMLVFAYRCAKRAKPLGGFYKAINVCGRWYNFFMMDFLGLGVFGWMPFAIMIVSAKATGETIGVGMLLLMVLLAAIVMAVSFILGRAMYKRAYAKCPDELKGRFFKDMMVIFLGTSFRFGFFFFMFIFKTWWALSKPTEYIVNGKTVYAFPGCRDLYDDSGNCVGVANDDRTKAVMY